MSVCGHEKVRRSLRRVIYYTLVGQIGFELILGEDAAADYFLPGYKVIHVCPNPRPVEVRYATISAEALPHLMPQLPLKNYRVSDRHADQEDAGEHGENDRTGYSSPLGTSYRCNRNGNGNNYPERPHVIECRVLARALVG